MVRTLVLAVALAMAATPSPPAAPPAALAARGYWLQPVPEGEVETAVHDIVTDPALAGTPQAAHALRDRAARHPDSAAAISDSARPAPRTTPARPWPSSPAGRSISRRAPSTTTRSSRGRIRIP